MSCEAIVGGFHALLFILQSTDWQLPYFSFEKKNMYKIEKYYQRLRAVPTWFQPRWKWFKSLLILMSTKKTHAVSLNTHRVQSECLLPESTNRVFFKRLRYRWVGSEKWSDWADTEAVINRVKRDHTVGLTHRAIRVSLYAQAYLFDL